MAAIAVGCGQITWGQFATPGINRRSFDEQILAEIAQAGYAGAPASPHGDRSPEDVLALYARFGLRPAPGYLGADFWKRDRRDQILEQARRFASFTHEVGCTELYVAAGGFDYVTRSGRTRREVAGHVSPADALSDGAYQQFAETLMEVAETTLKEGVRSCFHNHVGTVIETRDEIERLLGLVDPNLVFLGPDTGHLAWAGADVVEFFGAYAERVKTLHIKDIDPVVLERGREQQSDYGTFVKNGIFTELGEGFVDFPVIVDLLRAAGFEGWVIAETDVTQKPSALESVTISRAYLKRIGL